MKSTLEMAHEAGIRDCTCNGTLGCLERFAELVRAADRAEATIKLEKRVREAYQDGHSAGVTSEREACAKVCDAFQKRDVGMQPAECAGAIRARSNT